MGCRVGLRFVLPVIGLVLACAFAASAGAYTYVVRPNTTISAGSWTVVPSGTIDSVLDDNVLTPTAPSTASDYIEENGNGPVTFEVGLSDVVLRGGENVTSVKGWGYVTTGDSRSIDSQLRTSSTVLASGTWPAGLPASWQSLTYTGTLSQAEVDDLRQRRTIQGSGASTATRVYASYAEVVTDMAAPAPTITSGPGVAGQSPTPSWSFTSTLAAGFECRLEKGATVVSDWAACTSAKSYDLTATGDGSYTFRVRGVDDLGTAGPDASYAYTLDRVAPTAPTIDTAPPAQSNNQLAQWSFTGEGGGSLESCRLERGATVISDWSLCTSPRSYNLASPEIDGTYTFRVHTTDMAGNVSGDSVSSFTLDRAAPAAPTITSSPPASGNSSSPAWSFTYEAGATVACRIERGATVVSDWAPCSSPKTWDLSAEADGAYTFRVRATDAALNQGAEATGTYTMDHTAPAAPTITGGPAADSSDQTPQFSFTAEAGSTTQCRIDRPGFVVSDWASCSSPKTYNLNAQPDATYTFRVRATDAATNQGPEATRSYNLDRSAPAATTITGGPPSSSADPAPSFSFTHEAGATAECKVMRGTTTVFNWGPCSSPTGYDLTAEVDGTYVFHVRATDAAGNVGVAATRSWVLDRVEPVAPTITGRPSPVTNDDTPTWTFTASFDVVKYRCHLDRGATVVFGYAVCTSPHTYDLSALPDGTYTFGVRGSDDAANESTETQDTFTLDRSAPAAPNITGGPLGESANAMPSYTFTAEAGSSTECRVERGATVVSDWAACVSPRSYDFTLQSDGVYTFRVKATDTAGNTGPESTRVYTLDRTAPAAPVVTSGPAADSNDDTPVYSFTGEVGATFACRLERGATIVSDWTSCSTPVGYDLSSPAPDGTYTFRVRATDPAGNTSSDGTRVYALDRVPPPAPTLTSSPGADTNDATPTWGFTAAGGTTTACRIERGATVVSDWASCSSPKTYDLSALVDGSYTFRVRATDAAGNTGAETADTTALDRVDPPAPTITGGPTSNTADPTPAFTFTHEAGATASCRIERGATVVSDWASCSSPRSYDLTAETDGGYTFRVRATDPAGNTGAESTRSFTLDRQAPNQPSITARPAASTNDDTPTWSWTADVGATDNCRITSGATVVVDWTTCAPPRTFDLSAQADGTYTFRVRSSDPAGNISTEANDTFALDRVAPVAPAITGGPTGDSGDDTPTYTFTAEAGAAIECRIERSGLVVSDWASCVAPRSYDLTLQPDATYTFSVRATDAAGNTGPESTRAYNLDRTAPAAPVITGGPAGDQQDATPTYTWTGEIGAASDCRVERGATVVSDWAPCSTPQTFDISGEIDGLYTFRVTVTDAAGNTSADSTRDYTLDRTAPAAPAITAGPTGESSDDTPTYTWTAESGSVSECRVERGATVVEDWTTCAAPHTYDLSSETDGSYDFRVRAIDAAGNVGSPASRGYTLDRVPPGAPSITSKPAASSSDDTPAWGWSADADAVTFRCRVERGATVVSDWTACTDPRGYDLSGEVDGTYTFRVRASDLSGNEGTGGIDTYTLDRSAPVAPSITGGPTGDSADDTPTYTWTGEAGSTSECRVERGATVVDDWAACTSPHTPNLGSQPDGLYTFRVRVSDAAGNTGADSTRDYTLDRTAPAAPTITSAPPADSTDDSPTYGFTAEAGATLECRLQRGATVVDDWAPCTSPHTYDVTAEPDGSYTFRVRATDISGNTGPDATNTYTLDRTLPAGPTLDARPGDDGNDRTPQWAFSTTEPSKTFECRLARGATVLFDWGPCASPRQFDLTLEPDGTYDFSVRAVNLAGTRSPVTTDTYRFDTAAPAAPNVSGGPAADSTDDTPSWTIAAEPGAVLECRLERGSTVVSDWAACSSPQGYDLTTEPDGTYTFLSRATDAGGNTGAPGSTSYNLDRTTPSSPTLGSTPPAAGSDDTPTWDFTGDPGTTFECRVTRGGTVVTDWTACTSPFTPDLTSQPDGTYTVEVRAVNPAGTASPVTSDDYVLDRGTPAAPVITDGPAADSPDDTPTWSFTGEATATFECRMEQGATVVSDWTACTDPETSDLSTQADAAYTFRVRQTDPAGNTSPAASRSYTLDRTIPGAPSIDARPVDPGADQTPDWTISGTAGYTLECRLTRGPDVISDWASCTSPKSYDLTAEPDAGYTFHARQFSPAGTRGAEVTDDYELDVTAPAAPAITAKPGAVGNGSNPAWSFTAEAGAAVECRLQRGAVEVRPWAACTSPRSFGLAGEPDGDYTFSVRATDAAGNTGPAAVDAHRVDRVAPAPPAIGSGPGPLGRGRTPSWSFTAEDGATFECTLERAGGTLEPWAVCNTPRGYDLAGQDDGAFAFAVRARDAAGNTSLASSSAYVLDTTPGAVSIEGGPGALGRNRSPEWRFSGEEGASFECRLALRDVPVADWGACVSPRGFDLSGRPDGTFAFSLRATDPAGNVGPVGQADYELDTTPPGAPSIDRRPDTPGEDHTPTWRFSGEPSSTFSCRVEREPSGTVLDWTLCASPFTADLAQQDDAKYRFLVRATDLAGNVGEPAGDSYELASPVVRREDDKDDGSDGKTGNVPPSDDGGPLTDAPKVTKTTPAAPVATPRKRSKPPRDKPEPRETHRRAEPPVAASKPSPPKDDGDEGGNFATRAVADAIRAITENPDKSVFPLSLLLLVLAFLAIQNRIDRSDPKLALAPAFADPDLEFRPPPGD
jgi:predicted phage tail protein